MAEYNREAAAGRRLRLETSTDGLAAPRGCSTVPDDHVDPNNLLGGRGAAEDFATSATGEFQNRD